MSTLTEEIRKALEKALDSIADQTEYNGSTQTNKESWIYVCARKALRGSDDDSNM